VASNAGFLLLAYVLPRGLTFVAIVIAARVLGTEDFGRYGTAAAYAVILSILATLGMAPLLIRMIAQTPHRAPALLGAAHVAKTASNAVMLTALVALSVYVLDYPPRVVAAASLLGLAYAIAAYLDNLGAYFQATERMDIWLKASALSGLVTGGLGAAIVVATANLVLFCIGPVVGQLAALAWLATRLPPEVRRGGQFAHGDVARLLQALVPFAMSFIALTVYYKVDVVLLTRWGSLTEVGLYTAAYKFADLTIALASVSVAAMYPRLARVARGTPGQGAWAGRRTSELILLVTIPVAALLWLGRQEVVDVLYGHGYAAAASPVALIAPALPALTLNIFAGYLLAAYDRMYRVAAVYGVGALVKLLFNWWWIPELGASGAALAMLATEWLVGIAFLGTLAHTLGAIPRPRAAAVAAAAGSAAIPAALLAGPLGALGSAVAYGSGVAWLYWRSAVVPPNERALLRSAFLHRRLGTDAEAAGVPGPS
jgi:PST family polysaccharide transporter